MKLLVEVGDYPPESMEGGDGFTRRIMGRREIRVNGRRMPNDFEVTVEERLNEGRTVLLDGARPLFDTEVYAGGVCVAKVPGLLS